MKVTTRITYEIIVDIVYLQKVKQKFLRRTKLLMRCEHIVHIVDLLLCLKDSLIYLRIYEKVGAL